MNLILKDGTTYEILGFDPGKSIVMHQGDMDGVRTVWAKLTDENLSEYSVEDEGSAAKHYDCSVKQIRFEAEPDAGYVEVTFLLTQKERSEEYQMIRALEAKVEELASGKEMLEECIMEMSEIVYA